MKIQCTSGIEFSLTKTRLTELLWSGRSYRYVSLKRLKQVLSRSDKQVEVRYAPRYQRPLRYIGPKGTIHIGFEMYSVRHYQTKFAESISIGCRRFEHNDLKKLKTALKLK